MIKATYNGNTYNNVTKLTASDGTNTAEVTLEESGVVPTPTGTKSITSNGNDIDVAEYAKANVNVPNSYSAGDEGKVVSNGSLVSQTSDTVTTNNTYDTTLISSLTVNVSGGGGLTKVTGSFTPAENTQVMSVTSIGGTPKVIRILIDNPSTNVGDGTIKGIMAVYVYGIGGVWSTNNGGTGVGSVAGMIDLDASGDPVVYADDYTPSAGSGIYATATGFVARTQATSNYGWKAAYTYNWEAWI